MRTGTAYPIPNPLPISKIKFVRMVREAYGIGLLDALAMVDSGTLYDIPDNWQGWDILCVVAS